MNNNVNLSDYKQNDGKYDLLALYRAIYGTYDEYSDPQPPEGFERMYILIAALERKAVDFYDAYLDKMVMRVPDVPVHPLLVEAWTHNQMAEPSSDQIVDQLLVADRKIYDQELAQHITTEGNYVYVSCAELEIAFDWNKLRELEATKAISTEALELARSIQRKAVLKLAAALAPEIIARGEANWTIRDVWLLSAVEYLDGIQPYSMPKNTADLLDLTDVMTATEVQETYGLSESTVRSACQRGTIPARKSAGTWLIRRADAEARWSDRRIVESKMNNTKNCSRQSRIDTSKKD